MSATKRDQLRIISGSLKGRRIPVPDGGGVRPTSDRAKTTLFNWLAFDTAGARTLDLFAGTGSLGLESLSRGASHATFVDNDRKAVSRLQGLCERFAIEANRFNVIHGDAIAWLAHQHQDWDIVFVDPPFASISHYESALELLRDRIAKDGLIYVECGRSERFPIEGFKIWKESMIGEVRMTLLELAN